MRNSAARNGFRRLAASVQRQSWTLLASLCSTRWHVLWGLAGAMCSEAAVLRALGFICSENVPQIRGQTMRVRRLRRSDRRFRCVVCLCCPPAYLSISRFLVLGECTDQKMAATDSISIFAEGTFEEQVRWLYSICVSHILRRIALDP